MSKRPAFRFVDLDSLALEALITENAERYCLRYSSEHDLAGLTSDLTDHACGRPIKSAMTEWAFVSLEDREEERVIMWLVGMVSPTKARMTSDVVGFDFSLGLVATQSGSLYQLSGPPTALPLPTYWIIGIARTLNNWGIGRPLGIPPFY